MPSWNVAGRVSLKVPPEWYGLVLNTAPLPTAVCPRTSTPTWCSSVATSTTSATGASWRTCSSTCEDSGRRKEYKQWKKRLKIHYFVLSSESSPKAPVETDQATLFWEGREMSTVLGWVSLDVWKCFCSMSCGSQLVNEEMFFIIPSTNSLFCFYYFAKWWFYFCIIPFLCL